MTGPLPDDFLEVMRKRTDVLEALGGEVRTKRELEGDLDVSRSTVDRGVRELEENSLVERADGGYRQTLTGRLVLAEYERFRRRIGGTCDGAPLLAELDRDAEVGPQFLAGADVVEATRTSPHRPIEELYGYVERADHVRGFAPSIHPQQVEIYHRRITEEGMSATVVMTEPAVERLLSEYDEQLKDGLRCERARFFTTEAELAYSLTIADLDDRTVAGAMVYGRDGIRGCIVNDAEAAVEWAVERYEQVRETAEEIAEPPAPDT